MSTHIQFGDIFAAPLRNGVSYSAARRGSGVPMVNMKEIFAFDRISNEECELAPLTDKERLSYLLESWDLLFARQSLTFEGAGKCSLVLPADGERTFESHLMRVRLNPAVASAPFYYYYFRSSQGRRNIETIVQQVAAAGIRGSDLARLKVPFPPLSIQQAIAEILGALDDKIAANSRLTQTLDNYFMTRWSALSADDSLRKVKLTELVGDVIGGDWGKSESTDMSTEEVLCIRGADIADLQGSGLGNMPRRFIKPNSLCRRRLAQMDLVVEMSGGSPTQSTGRVVLITDAMLKRLPLPLSSSNFCRIVRLGNSQDAYFIYALLRESWSRGEFFQFENGSTGIKNLAFADFCSSKEVRMPEQSHLQGFNRLADGLFMQMQSLGEESARLRATRDTLLPQLMSRKLRVKDAEKVLENAGV